MSLVSKQVSRNCIQCDGPSCESTNPRHCCTRCRTVYYCGKACQRRHWPEHKSDCRDVERMKTEVADIGATLPTAASGATNSSSCCGICLEKTSITDDPVVIMPGCGHVFCAGCLRQWQRVVQESSLLATTMTTKAPNEITCPYCRTTKIENVDQALLDRAHLYAARADKIGTLQERNELCDLALGEVDKILDSDNEDLQALFTKTEVLIIRREHQGALEICKRMLQIHKENEEKYKQLTLVLDKVKEAMDSGNDEEAERLLTVTEELRDTSGNMHRFAGRGEASLFDVKIKIALVQEAMEDWTAAKETYKGMIAVVDDPNCCPPPLQRMIVMGISRCSYELGEYEKAIFTGELAIKMNRHFPEVHKYVALSHKAMGNLETARHTMNRAVLYETPWDEENAEQAMKLFLELSEDS